MPGLPAKDVIDIQLTVDSLNSVDITALEQVGFEHKPDVSDHCPPGLMLPSEELNKLLFRSTNRPAHLHVREAGRFNQRYALVCRDFLRTHPIAASAYGLIKQRLAGYFPDDKDAYYAIKDPVFDIIVEGANEWAERTGWSEPAGD